MILFWLAQVSAICPLKEIPPFDRPVFSLAQNSVTCAGWMKNVCCEESSLLEISRSLEEAKKTAKCEGCMQNLEALLCAASCSPALIHPGNSSSLEISPIFCAAAQLSCDGKPQCIDDSLFETKLKSLTGRAVNFQPTEDPQEELLPVSAECSPYQTAVLPVLPVAKSGLWLQIFFLLCVVVGLWISAKMRTKRSRNFQEWASLDLNAGESRRL